MIIIKRHYNYLFIYLIGFIIVFFLFRTNFPILKYPFGFLLGCVFINEIVNIRKWTFTNFIILSRYFKIVLLLFAVFIISLFLTHKFYISIAKELINIIILIFIFYLMIKYIKNIKEFKLLLKILFVLLLFLSLIFSLIQLLLILNIFSSSVNDIFNNLIPNNIDYNFASLFIIFSLFGLLYLISKNVSIIYRVLISVALLICTFSIFLLGSKRGIIFLLIFIISLFLIQIIRFFSKKIVLKVIARNTLIYLFFITFIITYFYLFFNASYDFRINSLKLLGSNDVLNSKEKIALKLFRYYRIIYKDSDYLKFYDKLWTSRFNPKDPESGWGTKIHKTIYSLEGDSVEIVPTGSRGYLMDSSCDGVLYNDKVYSWTSILYKKISKHDELDAFVYCFVSPDYNGESPSIRIRGENIDLWDEYDLKRIGTWQKLSLKYFGMDNYIDVFLFFSKHNDLTFKSLKGYVIFAYPYYKITNSQLNLIIDKDSSGVSIDTCRLSFINSNYNRYYLSFFSLDSYAQTNLSLYRDSIKNSFLRIFTEDTVYYGLQSKISIDTITNKFTDMRTVRWKFGFQLFFKEYNLTQKLFGDGFNFLNWYGYYFLGDKTLSEYPHNPFVHILLYSGLFGLFLYLFLLLKVVYLYFFYIKEYFILFIYFIVTFYFTFFSGGNPFDPSIMGFFMMLPFFIHYIHEKDKEVKFQEKCLIDKVHDLKAHIPKFKIIK